MTKMDTKPKAGMRIEIQLWVLTLIFVLANLLSCYSTKKGMETLFFVGAPVLALIASAVVQVTEMLFSSSWRSLCFWLAFAISVSLSSFQFVEIAYSAGQFREVVETAVQQGYTQLLPNVQQDVSNRLDTLRTTVFTELDDLAEAAEATETTAANNETTFVDEEKIQNHYNAQKSRYPKGWEDDTMYLNLLSAAQLVSQGESQSTEVLIDQSLSALDGIVELAATNKQKALYRDIRTDFNNLKLVISTQDAQNNTGAVAVIASIKSVRTALMQGTVETTALRAEVDSIVEQAMALELDIDTSELAELRDSVTEYATLVDLNTSLQEHQNAQTALAQRIAVAGEAEDDDKALKNVQTIWREELEGLRAEIASSSLPKKAEHLSTLDALVSTYLQKERNSIQTTWAVLQKEVGLRNALPGMISILMAALLDLTGSATVKRSKKLRRQRAEQA